LLEQTGIVSPPQSFMLHFVSTGLTVVQKDSSLFPYGGVLGDAILQEKTGSFYFFTRPRLHKIFYALMRCGLLCALAGLFVKRMYNER
ncbi:MAG: hypothetical protein SOZ52_01905, partial [Pyramidobacter sp.]|nr:hypothetical protein [Pyramidobacter sp.]